MSPPDVFTLGSLCYICGTYFACINISKMNGPNLLMDPDQLLLQFLLCPQNLAGLFACSLIAICTLLVSFRPLSAITIALIPFLSFSYATFALPKPLDSDLFFLQDESFICFEAVILDTRYKDKLIVHPQNLLFPYHRKLSGLALVELKGIPKKNLPSACKIEVRGKVKPISKKHSDFQFDEKTFFAKKKIFCKIKTYEISRSNKTPEAPDVFAKFNKLSMKKIRKNIIETHISHLGNDSGKLLASIVLGDRAVKLPDRIRESFRATGLSHLLAASGFNLSILVGSIYFLCRRIQVSKMLCISLSLISIIGFVGLAGSSPSVSRAALLCGLILIGRLIYRRFNPVSLLTFTLLLFCISDPLSILDIGLQLSYAATYSIVIGIKNATLLVNQIANNNIAIKWLLELVCVISLAQAAVLPIQLFYFWELGLFFLIANILVDPIIAPITIIGFASCLLSITGQLVEWIYPVLNQCIYALDLLVSLPLEYMQKVSTFLTSINNSTICIGPPSASLIIFYYVSLLLLISRTSSKKQLALYIALFIIALTLLFSNSERHPDWVFTYKNHLVFSCNNDLYSLHKLSYSLRRRLKFNGINPAKVKELNLKVSSQFLRLDLNQYTKRNRVQDRSSPKIAVIKTSTNNKNVVLIYTAKFILIATSLRGKFKPLNMTPEIIALSKSVRASSSERPIIVWAQKLALDNYSQASSSIFTLNKSNQGKIIYPAYKKAPVLGKTGN